METVIGALGWAVIVFLLWRLGRAMRHAKAMRASAAAKAAATAEGGKAAAEGGTAGARADVGGIHLHFHTSPSGELRAVRNDDLYHDLDASPDDALTHDLDLHALLPGSDPGRDDESAWRDALGDLARFVPARRDVGASVVELSNDPR